MHRSALGKTVDMSSLVSKNEKVRAVGNMNVNARGDIIDSHGRVVQDNTQRVKRQYSNTVNKPSIQEDVQPEVVTPIVTPPPIVEVIAPDLNLEEQKMFEEFDDYEEVEEIKQTETEKPKAKK
jgi:hypothetical protein